MELLIVSLAVIVVIHGRSGRRIDTQNRETSTHVSELMVNSEISRRVFTLTSRVRSCLNKPSCSAKPPCLKKALTWISNKPSKRFVDQ
ncbi:hypothetical protein O9992_27635 [Vibrio lentus]|nr:hypothetical protein [Vibrio lentus]